MAVLAYNPNFIVGFTGYLRTYVRGTLSIIPINSFHPTIHQSEKTNLIHSHHSIFRNCLLFEF